MENNKHVKINQLLSFRSFILGIFLAILVYLVIIIWSGWDELITNILRVNPLVIIIAMLLSLTNYFFRFLKWVLFTKSLELKIPLLDNLLIFFAGLSLAITPAKAGEAIRAFLLQKMNTSDLSKGLASTFSERLIDLLAVTLLALIGILSLGSRLSIQYMPLLLLILLIIIIGVIVFLLDPLYNLFSKIFWFEAWKFLGSKIDKFRSDVVITLRMRTFLGALLLGIIGWTCEGLGFFLIAQNLDINLTVDAAVFIYAASSLLGAISFLPGGLGVMEGSMEVFLADFLRISAALAGALIILIRFTTLWFGVGLGLIILLIVVKRLDTVNEASKLKIGEN
ncbi:MAG: lysylphosphatidylglycerol synthase transmembrane domain-containing protein [Candidatus Hodarchaeales archaeon]